MKFTPSALDFTFVDDEIREILEEHVRNLLSGANLSNLSTHKHSEGHWVVSVWNDGNSLASAGEPIVLSESNPS